MLHRTVSCGLALGILALTGAAEAASLSDQLHQFLEANVGIPKAESVTGAPVEFVDTAVPILQRLEVRGADFPVTSTSPGFSFRYNPELGIFEPATSSLGPVFVDRADTIGGRRLDVSATYLFARLTEVEGESLKGSGDDLASVFSNQAVLNGPRTQARTFNFDEFALEQHVLNLSLTYGLTDAWDVNLLVPIIGTRLIARGVSTLVTATTGGPSIQMRRASLDADHEGFGDVQLRTKYLLGEQAGVKFATGLAFRSPTGDENNFQGIGDFTITPSLIASKEVGRHDFHLNVGMEVDAEEVIQTRARWAIGTTLQPFERVAYLLDFIGNSNFVNENFEFTTGRTQVLSGPGIRKPSVKNVDGTFTHFAFVPRTDIIDATTGFKFLLVPGRAVAHLGVIYPLNSDGLRAKVIPTGNIEVAF